MPRNASGTYTLPQSAYVSGTVITSTAMNSNLSDIATALTGSIAANGSTPITAPILFTAGTVSVPGISFIGDADTGIYQVSANSVGVAAGGTQIATFSSLGLTIPATSAFVLSTASITFSSAAIATAFLTALAENFSLVFTIDGGGSVPTTGDKGFLEVPCGCTITRVTTLADQSGSAVVDIKKSTYAGFPPSASICASAKPTLSTAQKAQDSTLTGWTTACAAGDILLYNLNSVTTCTRIQVYLLCTRLTR